MNQSKLEREIEKIINAVTLEAIKTKKPYRQVIDFNKEVATAITQHILSLLPLEETIMNKIMMYGRYNPVEKTYSFVVAENNNEHETRIYSVKQLAKAILSTIKKGLGIDE